MFAFRLQKDGQNMTMAQLVGQSCINPALNHKNISKGINKVLIIIKNDPVWRM